MTNNIITIDKRDAQNTQSIKKELKTKGGNFLNKTYNLSFKKILLGTVFVLLIFIILYVVTRNNITDSIKNNTNNINNTNNTNNTNNNEGFKTSQIRDDNYNDFDIKTAITDLIEKQENYLENK